MTASACDVILDSTAWSRRFLVSTGRLGMELPPKDFHSVSAKSEANGSAVDSHDFNTGNDDPVDEQVDGLRH